MSAGGIRQSLLVAIVIIVSWTEGSAPAPRLAGLCLELVSSNHQMLDHAGRACLSRGRAGGGAGTGVDDLEGGGGGEGEGEGGGKFRECREKHRTQRSIAMMGRGGKGEVSSPAWGNFATPMGSVLLGGLRGGGKNSKKTKKEKSQKKGQSEAIPRRNTGVVGGGQQGSDDDGRDGRGGGDSDSELDPEWESAMKVAWERMEAGRAKSLASQDGNNGGSDRARGAIGEGGGFVVGASVKSSPSHKSGATRLHEARVGDEDDDFDDDDDNNNNNNNNAADQNDDDNSAEVREGHGSGLQGFVDDRGDVGGGGDRGASKTASAGSVGVPIRNDVRINGGRVDGERAGALGNRGGVGRGNHGKEGDDDGLGDQKKRKNKKKKVTKEELRARLAALNEKYGVKPEKGINLDMLVAASAGKKDNGVALKDAKRSKEDAEQRIREIKQMFNDDLKLRPVKRMDVAVKRELHAEMRALQQQRGEFKRKVYELELKKTYNKEQKQRIAEGRKPFMVKDVTKKGAYKWDKDRVSET